METEGDERYFLRHLQSLLNTGPSRPARIALCTIGLDRFTRINEVFGHRVGDCVLGEIAERLRQVARGPGRTGTRLRGDEFVVLVPDTNDVEEAKEFVAQMLDYLARPMYIDRRWIKVTASAGIVETEVSSTLTAAHLLTSATSAMSWAKADGRDRYRVFTGRRDNQERRRQELSSEFPLAIEAGDIVVYYQQLQDLTSRHARIVGFEALARWKHPSHDLIQPNEFISLAHELGLMRTLGEHVLRQACQHAAGWLEIDGTRPYVSVNVAAEQLTDPGFVDVVVGALDDARLPPQRLQLELTESSAIAIDERTISTMGALARQQIAIVIDDFGTGHSNLDLLPPTLPVTGIKLDRRFLSRLADPAQLALLKEVVAMGRRLRLRVTAEGIQQQREADALRKLGCHVGQGFLFGQAGPADKVNEVIRRTERHRRDLRGARRAPGLVSRGRRAGHLLDGLLRGA
jgi:diguanylate cyclase (GGDEF)-like protein